MDINSFVTGFAMGKKNAKKPILTELTVTENGVYDEPVIVGGLEPITWDGVIGDRTIVSMGSAFYIKVSDMVLNREGLIGCTIVTVNGQKFDVDDSVVFEMGDVLLATEIVVSVPYANAIFAFDGTDIVFPEAGIYFAYFDTFYPTSLTFPAAAPTPADGWNKVTVNVAGDIIDVPELPTENIEEGKIYRITDGDTVTYGIPNANPVKRLVDGAWVELA